MKRILAPMLRRLFEPKTTMDFTTSTHTEPDPIGAALGAAVDEHARVYEAETTGYERRLRETMGAIDDVFQSLGKQRTHG